MTNSYSNLLASDGTHVHSARFLTARADTTVDLSTNLAETLQKIGVYFPAMLGVMAINALVLICLVVALIVFLCKRRSASVARVPTARPIRGRSTPMPMNSSKTNSYVDPVVAGGQAHAYERVANPAVGDEDLSDLPMEMRRATYAGPSSMSEDAPFSPPSPSALRRQWNNDNNPVSMALTEDTLFVPPSPGFKSFKDNDRPKSMA